MLGVKTSKITIRELQVRLVTEHKEAETQAKSKNYSLPP